MVIYRSINQRQPAIISRAAWADKRAKMIDRVGSSRSFKRSRYPRGVFFWARMQF